MRVTFCALFVNIVFAAQSSQPLFFTARRVYGQEGTRDIAIADFNRDGNLDVAVANENGPVEVLLGNGHGTFRQGPATQIAPDLNFVITADFNADAIPDLAFSTRSGPQIFVALGVGDGTFSPPLSITVGNNGHLIAADFNTDKKPDLAVCTTSAVTLLLGRGDGTFDAPSVLVLPAKATNLAAGDLNNDGNQDLVATTSAGISAFFGNGNGTFQPPKSTAIQDGALAAAVSDLDGDGLPDLALSVGKYKPQVAILKANGKGGFSPPTYYNLPHRSESIAIGDVNGDQMPDVVTANVCVLIGQGSAVMSPARLYTAAYDPSHSILADLSGNGKPDIVTADWGGSSVSVLMNRGNGTFIESIQQQVPAGFGPLATGDFNGDGMPDVAGIVGFGVVQILLGTGKLRGPFTTGQSISVPSADYQLVTADFNRDGILDLAMPVPSVTLEANKVAVLLGRGDGTFTGPTLFDVASTFASSLVAADFNGDGRVDLLNSGTSILLGRGNGAFQTARQVSGTNYVSIAAADFDGDGNIDFAGVPATNMETYIDLFLGNGNGTFQPPLQVPTGQVPWLVISSDFDGDGQPDLAVTTYLNGAAQPFQLSILLNRGGGSFGLSQIGSNPSSSPGVPIAADLNGDGIPDLAITDGNGMMVDMYLGNGDGTFRFTASFGTDPNAGALVAGPFHAGSRAGMNDIFVSTGHNFASLLVNETR